MQKPPRKPPAFQDRFITSRISIDFLQHFGNQESSYKEVNVESFSEVSEDNVQNRLYDVLMKSQILGLRHNLQHSTARKILTKEDSLPDELNPKHLFCETSTLQNQVADNRFSLSPVGGLDTPDAFDTFKNERIISKTPYKVLDAPELQDDYYMDVVHWSKKNVLAVGLGKALYLWVASNSKVIKLHEFAGNDSAASVAWSPEGTFLAVGTNKGFIHIWDYIANKELLKAKLHNSRVGTISWDPHSLMLSTGSRDRTIIHRDIRTRISASNLISRSIGHRQEVCGLRWSPDGQYIGSGGNDNKVLVWSRGKLDTPCIKFNEHTAAVKAIAWSPHQNGLLATGGGTTDRSIKLWDVTREESKGGIDTGSQVCNMVWGVNSDELVTTHGYSNNYIAVWKLNPLKSIAQLSGHLSRVVYLAISPDGESIVTGSGDETLRFWQIFPPNKYQNTIQKEWEVYPSQYNIR